MILERYESEDGRSTYLLGDVDTQNAVLIDPCGEVSRYLHDAEKRGLRIRHVFESDANRPVRALLELQERSGARVHRIAGRRPLANVNPLLAGSSVRIGRFRVERCTEGDGRDALRVYDLYTDEEHPALVARAA